jgi:hypothetical protein
MLAQNTSMSNTIAPENAWRWETLFSLTYPPKLTLPMFHKITPIPRILWLP